SSRSRSTRATTSSTRRTCSSPSRSSRFRSPTGSSTTPRFPTTRNTRDPRLGRERAGLDGVGGGRLRLHRLRHRGRLVLEPLLLGALADREPRLAGGALPA